MHDWIVIRLCDSLFQTYSDKTLVYGFSSFFSNLRPIIVQIKQHRTAIYDAHLSLRKVSMRLQILCGMHLYWKNNPFKYSTKKKNYNIVFWLSGFFLNLLTPFPYYPVGDFLDLLKNLRRNLLVKVHHWCHTGIKFSVSAKYVSGKLATGVNGVWLCTKCLYEFSNKI